MHCIRLPLLACVLASSPMFATGRLDAADNVVTVAGNGTSGYSGDGNAATRAQVSQPFGIVTGPDDAIYVCEVGSHAIRRIDPTTSTITTVAGCGQQGYSGNGQPATEAKLNEPYEVRFASNGDMYFVEMQNHIVRKVDAETGIISLIAGTGKPGFRGDGGPARDAQLSRPHSIALDGNHNLYICDIGNHRIRRVDLSSGIISTFSGTGEKKSTPDGALISGTPLNGPRALDFDGKTNLFLALREGNAIYRLNLQSGTLHHVAGTGKSGYSGDGGPAAEARLSGPKGICLAPNGDIYFADTESHTIRMIRRDNGVIQTVVGNGSQGDGPDGPSLKCQLNRPHGVFVSSAFDLLIGDSSNHRVRRLHLKPSDH